MHPSSHPITSPPHHLASVSIASYLPDRHLCLLHCPRGKLLHSMAHHTNKQHLLHVEEALYLLERGLLELLYDDVPMSVQECYGLLEEEAEICGLDTYMAYAELKGQGWVVLRPSALYREKRPSPPPPPPTADSEQQQEQRAEKATMCESAAAEDEVNAAIAKHNAEQAAAMEPLPADEQHEWADLQWGCTDEAEQARSTRLLQLPFLSLTTAHASLPLSVLVPSLPVVASSVFELLCSLQLFFLWPPSTVGSFRRSSPPRPSHLLLVSDNSDDEQLAAVLRTSAGVMAVWERAEREMRGADGNGERVVIVQGVPLLLASVQLTHVSYMQFGPLSCAPGPPPPSVVLY